MSVHDLLVTGSSAVGPGHQSPLPQRAGDLFLGGDPALPAQRPGLAHQGRRIGAAPFGEGGSAPPVFQLAEDRQALGEHRDRRWRVTVVAVHDGELPEGPGFPPSVTEFPDAPESFLEQRDRLLAEVLITEYQDRKSTRLN